MALEGLPPGKFHPGHSADISLLVAMSKNSPSVVGQLSLHYGEDEEATRSSLSVLRSPSLGEGSVIHTEFLSTLVPQNLPGFCFSQGSWSL